MPEIGSVNDFVDPPTQIDQRNSLLFVSSDTTTPTGRVSQVAADGLRMPTRWVAVSLWADRRASSTQTSPAPISRRGWIWMEGGLG